MPGVGDSRNRKPSTALLRKYRTSTHPLGQSSGRRELGCICLLLVVSRRARLTICRWGGSVVRDREGKVGARGPTGLMRAVLVRSTLQG